MIPGRAALLVLALALAGPTQAGDKSRAAELLARAETAMQAANTPKQRLAALGQAAQAQEAALAALRGDLRALSDRGAVLDQIMNRRQRVLRAVLSAIERLGRAPPAATLAHPGGPVAAARAGMALAAFTPGLETEAARLRLALSELKALSARRDVAIAEARASLAALQAMRAEIATLLDNERRRKRLPADIVERLESESRALAASAANLRALSAALPAAPDGAVVEAGSIRQRRGDLPPPVEGVTTRAFGDGADGVTLSAPPYAEIYAPADGVIRFAGPYGDYGQLVILEPEEGLLFVFAGLGATLVRIGETVLEGEPIGAMGGPPPAAEEFLIEAGAGSEALGEESLYMEIRDGGAPVDPALWFAFDTAKR